MSCTIKDIVLDTKLSLATISKYLNGKNIRPENRAIIEESIQRLGYTPNKSAQMLRSRKTNTICILLPFIGDYFWGALSGHIIDTLQKYNYSTIVTSYVSSQDHTDTLKLLNSNQVDGAIVLPYSTNDASLLALLQKVNIPTICLDQVLSVPSLDVVTSANYKSAYNATKYLIEKGHSRIGVIGGDLDCYTSKERIRGFHEACNDFNIKKNNRIVMGNDLTTQSGAVFFHNMMTLASPPTAIFMLGYNLTIGAIMELNELNISIPEDISLVTFDDDQIFAAFSPPITVVVQNLPEMGRRAAELLMKRIQKDMRDFPEIVMIDTDFIERESVRTFI